MVNDQIWSNSKFKIALKVQDVADSREVIKTPDAAEITQTGRAYLQVGNNEIYELFQSAWSGADYNPEGRNHVQKNTTVYEITSNGQYNAINKDLSGLVNRKEAKAVPTELDAIVEKDREVFDGLHIHQVASPWLPPLEEKIYAKDTQSTNFRDYWGRSEALQPILIRYQDINSIGMYLDQGAVGVNHAGTEIRTAPNNTKDGIIGVVALNNAIFKNYGKIVINSDEGSKEIV